jgi:hypothetical protein
MSEDLEPHDPIDDEVTGGEADPAKPDWTDEDAAEAKAFGWKSPDEWAGEKPKGYIDDPRRYMDRAETFRPFKVLRDRSDKLEAEYSERFRKIEATNSATIERQRKQYDIDIESIKRQQLDAVDTADRERYDVLERQKSTLERPMEMPAQQQHVPDQFVAEYAKTNDWVNNPILREVGAKLIEAGGYANRPAKEQIEYAEVQVRKMYPGMFAAPVTQATPMQNRVDGGGLGGRASGGAFAKLPSEAKSAFKRFVDQGIFQDNEADRKRYSNDYEAY